MEWLGLPPSQIAWVLGASILATLALHLLRPRRRVVVVPDLSLFRAVRAERRASAWLSRRIRLLSLLLSLAIVLLLGLSLGDPRWPTDARVGRTLVVLLDRSASMATVEGGRSRLDEAKRGVREILRGLRGGDRVCLVALDHRATPLAPCTEELGTLLAALEPIAPLAVHEDLAHGLALANDLLSDARRPEILLVTDAASRPAGDVFERLPSRIRVSHLVVGRHGENVAITSFAARRHPIDRAESEILVELGNPSKEERTVELVLSGDGRALDVSRVTIPARSSESRRLRAISGVDSELSARIRPVDGRPDRLALDDVAHAFLPPRSPVRVLAVTGSNLYLEAALLLDEHLRLEVVEPSRYSTSLALAHDVLVFDSFLPPEPPGRPAIYLHPEGEGPYRPFAVRGSCERPFFERIERDDPLLRYTALDDVNVAESPILRLEPTDRVLGADPRCPLLVRGRRDGQPVLVIAFDPRQSDLPLRVAWPMLLLRTIEAFSDRGGDFVSGYATGTVARVPVPGATRPVTLRTPSGRSLAAPVQDERAVFVPSEAGVHTIRWSGSERRFAALLSSPEESAIEPAPLPRIARTRTRAVPSRRASFLDPPWRLLAGLAFLLLIFEWMAHHRRWTA